MPKLYRYSGIVIHFYSNEHYPIHVHGTYNEFESKIELVVKDGKIVKYVVKKVKNRRHLPKSKLKIFEKLTKKLGDEIIQSWINFFVLRKPIVFKQLEGKL